MTDGTLHAKAVLRDALAALKPTGRDGFEGLLAAVLGAALGYAFRLAASGSQNGRDGAAQVGEHYVAFEAKLYGTKLPRTEVMAKVADLLTSAVPVDLWILGASCEVRAQIGDELAKMRDHGLTTLVLDWPDQATVPPLLAALAMAPEVTASFLAEHATAIDRPAVEDALATLSAAPEMQGAIASLREDLDMPSLGMDAARQANSKWLRRAFSDKRTARNSFGQALAPAAPMRLIARPRPSVDAQVDAALTDSSAKITVISGPEGSGKSWSIILRWLAASEPPLMLFVPAASIAGALDEPSAIDELLVKYLLAQTGENGVRDATERWRRRLKTWRRFPPQGTPRFVLVIDGLNENPARNWVLLLDRVAEHLEALGGNLVATSRAGFFTERVQAGLISGIVHARLEEWTKPELRALLGGLEIDSGSLAPRVEAALRNPRLLGIAVELLDAGELRAAEELSRERLLFEHIRRLGPPSDIRPEHFIRSLSNHASEIIAQRRMAGHQQVFDTLPGLSAERPLRNELDAVVGERYFTPLADDPTRYVLSDDGLSMALGIAIVRSLADAARTCDEIYEALDKLLEPVAALDRMTEAMSAALLTVAIDEAQSNLVRTALIRGYLRLQNIDVLSYPSFAAAIRSMPVAGLEALRQACLADSQPVRLRWLTLALRAARENPDNVVIIVDHVRDWLRLYTLKPDRNANRLNPRPDAEAHEAKAAAELAGKLAALSPAESALLAQLKRNDAVNTAVLVGEAFRLLAGLPLAPLAQALVGWAFFHTLNPYFHDPYQQFEALVRFNCADFQAARTALLGAAEPLLTPSASRTGRWTMVMLLRATSTLEDAAREAALVDELVDEPKWAHGRRSIEDYCATDPCDPLSVKPEGIEDTVERCRVIPLDKLAAARWRNEHDYILEMASTGLARFAPEAAVQLHHSYVANVLGRNGEALRMGVFGFEEHGALLGPFSEQLLELSRAHCEDMDVGGHEASKHWIIEQKTLLGGLLHLDGDAQIAALRSLPPHGPLLVQFDSVFRPASPETLANWLRDAVAKGNENGILAALAFVGSSGTPVCADTIAVIERLIGHERQAIDALALAALGAAENEEALARFAASSWNAGMGQGKGKTHLVAAYGSHLLLAAAKRGMVSAEDVVARVDATHLGASARIFGSEAAAPLRRRLADALNAAMGVDTLPPAPKIKLDLDNDEQGGPHFVTLSEREVRGSAREFFRDLNESDEQFDARQRGYQKRYEALNRALRDKAAHLVLDHISASALSLVLAHAPDIGANWAKRLLALNTAELPRLCNFALQLARVLSVSEPDLSVSLFMKVSACRPVMTIRIGLGGVPLETHCLWQSSDDPALRALRRERLRAADSDAALANEVLAACLAGKWSEVLVSARSLVASEVPADIARGLMLAGFGDEDAESEALFARFDKAQGLIGHALESARGAYDRNRWARGWHRRMMATEDPEAYWCASVLLRKIVDGRIDLWERENLPNASLEACDALLRRRYAGRIAKWRDKRAKTLFGTDAPDPVFLGDEAVEE